jgi:DNA polymerase-3 subunit alpha
LAKNTTGFKNLIKLASIAYLEGFYRHPRIDREVLEAHREGLICLSGCLAGEFNQYILRDKPDEAMKLARWFRKVFGEDFYIEIQNNGIAAQDACTPVAADIAHKLGIPLVATADAHYLCSEDARAHDVLFCINTEQMHDPRKKKYPEERMPNPYYVRSPEDMYRLFPDYPDAVARSQEIADAKSTSTSGTSPYSLRPKPKRPNSTCGNCASRACTNATVPTPRRRSATGLITS